MLISKRFKSHGKIVYRHIIKPLKQLISFKFFDLEDL
jgi:hypothetical protein